MAVDDGSVMLTAGEGKTVSFSGNRVRLIHGHPGGAYSAVEWLSEPGVPGTPLHIHRGTDEAFYVLEGTFGFQAGERTFEGTAGAFLFVPRGLEHAYWNSGTTPAKMLITISPPGFERYFEELVEGLAGAGDDAGAAMSVRKALSEKYDIEVVGPPRQATER
jgi:quercetin dioxygenase-like cupin family protein